MAPLGGLIVVALLILLLLLRYVLHKSWLLKSRLPPGPLAWPIIGNLNHLVGDVPAHHRFAQLADQFGSIFFLRLGSRPIVVVSSPRLAEELLLAKDQLFLNRPSFEQGHRMLYRDNIFFMQHGPLWRNMRKISTLELFTSKKLKAMKPLLMEEIFRGLQDLENASQGGQLPVNLTSIIGNVIGNILCRLLLSKKVNEYGIGNMTLKEAIHEMSILSGTPVFGDYIPYLGCLDRGTKGRMDKVHKLMDVFLQRAVIERTQEKATELGNSRDFLDALLSLKEAGELDNEMIKSIILDLVSAGTDTSTITVEWGVAELLRNPSALRKLQEELDSFVADKGIIADESDIASLPYLNAVIKETFRMHPAAPLLVPHLSTQACEVGGYVIPKGTTLIVSAWAIGRSPLVWENPDQFLPERFIGKEVDTRGKHCELIPFGAGRRMCPGASLGQRMVDLMLANLVRTFDWHFPDDESYEESVDMTEGAGQTTQKAKPLRAIPRLRLAALPTP